MHMLHIFKVHVKPEEQDPAQEACFYVESELDSVAEEMDTDEEGNDYSLAPFDYYNVIGAIDIKQDLFHYRKGGSDWREWAPAWNTIGKISKGYDLSVAELKDAVSEKNGHDYGEDGVTNLNCTPGELPTHLVIVDLHI